MRGQTFVVKNPLLWPNQQARTRPVDRRDASFQVDIRRAFSELVRNLDLLGTSDVIITTDLPVRRDGTLYADIAEPNDIGVSVFFDRKTKPFAIACDTFRKVRHNLRAIGLTIDALRAIQRYGATSMLEQAFTGFAALPPPQAEEPWWEVLGVMRVATPEVIKDSFRKLANVHHPDKGGDAELMKRVNKAFAEAMLQAGASA